MRVDVPALQDLVAASVDTLSRMQQQPDPFDHTVENLQGLKRDRF